MLWTCSNQSWCRREECKKGLIFKSIIKHGSEKLSKKEETWKISLQTTLLEWSFTNINEESPSHDDKIASNSRISWVCLKNEQFPPSLSNFFHFAFSHPPYFDQQQSGNSKQTVCLKAKGKQRWKYVLV